MTWTGLLAATACGCTVGSRVRGDRHLVPRVAHELAIVGHHKATAHVSRGLGQAPAGPNEDSCSSVCPTRPSDNADHDTLDTACTRHFGETGLAMKEH